jgi:hypothetical protein
MIEIHLKNVRMLLAKVLLQTTDKKAQAEIMGVMQENYMVLEHIGASDDIASAKVAA